MRESDIARGKTQRENAPSGIQVGVGASVASQYSLMRTFHCDLVFSGVGVREDLHVDGDFPHGVIHSGA